MSELALPGRDFRRLGAVAHEAAENALDSVAVSHPELAESAAEQRVPFDELEPGAQLIWTRVAEALWKEFEATAR